MAIAGANRHDSKLTRETIESILITLPQPTERDKQHLCLDAGYVGDEVDAIVAEFGYTMHRRSRGEEAKELKKSVRIEN